MKNKIWKNTMSLIHSIDPPQYKEGEKGFFLKKSRLLWVMVIFVLGIVSCDDSKSNHGAYPKFEDKPSSNNTSSVTQPAPDITVGQPRKIVYLNKTKFTVKDKREGKETIFELPINQGVDELLKMYAFAGPESEVMQTLTEMKPFLNQEFVDEIALKAKLVNYEAIKAKHPQSESFANFVNALALAAKSPVDDIGRVANLPPAPIINQPSNVNSSSTVEGSGSFSGLETFALVILVIGCIILFFRFRRPKKQNNALPAPVEEGKSTSATEKVTENKETEPRIIDVATIVFPEEPNKKEDLAQNKNKKESPQERAIRLQQEKTAARRLEEDNKVKKQLEKLEREKAELKAESERENAKLKAEIERLKMENQGKKVAESPTIESKDAGEEIVTPAPLPAPPNPVVEVAQYAERIYLSLPMNEMIFNNANRSPVPMVGQSFYEFFISNDGMTATFKFWNNPEAVKHAIDKPHSHIEPACEPINARDSYATQIFTEKGDEGYAVLQDNKWIVKTKAKIKYLT